MEPVERSFWEWAQIRTGQALLFWGTLELILESLDVLSKWDLLLTVRGSLAPGLEFLADPRMALLLVALAFLLLWDANRPKEHTRSVLDQRDQPAKKSNYSVIEATAIPFFLAFVCSISFAALEWNSPRREQLARNTLPKLSANVEHKLDLAERASRSTLSAAATTKEKPAVHADAGAGATAAGHSTPLITPRSLELDTDDATTADVAANPGELVSPPTLNRLVPLPGVIYAYNGERRVYDGGQATSAESDTPQHKLFDQIRQAHRSKDWTQLASLCETAIRQTPEWLTPYLFAGEAYANLGQIDRAIDRLEYVRKLGAGIPDDRFVVQQASKLRESIRIQYGR
ncbi:MAG TPA: hypothetical protein VJV74_10435 [Terriglobia bacterium]|nr:hypothetical protein [Terriglobia bacterium]